MSDEKTCGTCVRFVEIPLSIAEPDERIGVCECNWQLGLTSNRPFFEAMLPSDSIDDCGYYEPKEEWNARAAVTDEQFAMAVHEWALARMEGCDEPEWSMYSGIVDAIGRHRAASAKVVG